MPLLDAKDLSKKFGTRVLLDGVSLTIRRGERVGVVGDNGAGKSTLAKILGGILEADLGTIARRREARIEYLAQEPSLPSGRSARDVVLDGRPGYRDLEIRLGELAEALASAPSDEKLLEEQAQKGEAFAELGGYALPSEAERLLGHLGITGFDQDVGTMSGGERRRVALARVLLGQPELAILDEPTNHLDATTIEWLEEYLTERYEGALLLVTHDRFLLNRLVTRTLEVEAGAVHSYDGGWEEFLVARETRRAEEKRSEDNRQNFLRKEIEWLRRQPKARTGKQKARIDRANAAIAVKAPEVVDPLRMAVAEERLGGTILEAHSLRIAIGGRTLLPNVSFRLQKGMRLGILGPSGSGKTTLLRTLLGELTPASGEITFGKATKVAYLDQLRSGLDSDQSVFDAVTEGRPTVSVGEQTFGSYSYLERFRFRGEATRQKIAALSGGERARLSLAKLLLAPANVLVLDEPTNDLDVMTLGALEDLLLGLSGAAILVSHDRYFLDRVATHVLCIDEGGRTEVLAGGFTEYATRRAFLEAEAEASKRAEAERLKAQAEKSVPSAAAAKPKKLTYAEEKELGSLLGEIENLGEELAGRERELADPTLYTERHGEVSKKTEERDGLKTRLAALEERWLELEERKSAYSK